MKALSSLAVCCTLFGSLASADVRLPALVSDQMVLQRNDMVNIWGFASPGEAVSVVASWSGKVSEAVADEQGNWSVRVATGDEQGPQQLTIQGKNTLTVSDILLGEVWVCGGQSNMEWPLGRLTNYSELIAGANHPDIRLFTVKKKIAYTPEVDCVGTWQACTPEVVKDFSAVGFLYGRELSRELGVPIGLISCNWGGTVAEAWTSESTLASWQDFQAGLAAVREMAGDLEGVEA
ncbi:MAG: sialate O-acetylesterase, partial [Candidatus Paceibacteria bacterium]